MDERYAREDMEEASLNGVLEGELRKELPKMVPERHYLLSGRKFARNISLTIQCS